jgi:hypothetical protein
MMQKGRETMKLELLEILALTIIALSVVKLIIGLISPKSWLRFAKKMYVRPEITSAVALVLAAVVLYILISSGMTIVQILAVTLFVVLILTIGIARYGEEIIDWAMEQDLRTLIKGQWLYALIWVLLLGWGAIAIFTA